MSIIQTLIGTNLTISRGRITQVYGFNNSMNEGDFNTAYIDFVNFTQSTPIYWSIDNFASASASDWANGVTPGGVVYAYGTGTTSFTWQAAADGVAEGTEGYVLSVGTTPGTHDLLYQYLTILDTSTSLGHNDFAWSSDSGWFLGSGQLSGDVVSGVSGSAYTYPDGSTGAVYDLTTSGYIISPNLYANGGFQVDGNRIGVNMWFYPTANSCQLLGERNSQTLGPGGYHYTVLEINSQGHVAARFWSGTPLTSSNAVVLNKWNHIWFNEDGYGNHSFELNGVATGQSNPVYTRSGPGTTEYFVIGDVDGTNMGNGTRFQGKVGQLVVSDYAAESNRSNTIGKYDPAYINTGISLGYTWTVEIVADLHPVGYWATIWGNENYSAQTGHWAYLNSASSLNVGSTTGTNNYTLADDVAIKSHWVFVHTDGSGISVYRNGVLLTSNGSNYVQPSSPAGNTLLIGARHTNNGTGATDLCPGSYDWYNIQSTALDQTGVTSSYNSLKTTYNLP